MSRIGKKPIPVAKGVKVTIDGQLVKVEGPKGKLQHTVHPIIRVKLEDDGKQIFVTRSAEDREGSAMQGLTRALVANMVIGVSEGYRKGLDIQGVGYKAELKGKKLVLSVGYANTVDVLIPEGLKVDTDGTKVNVAGPDKQQVGQFAAELRKIRKPEPYKGKGIRYEGEVVKIKPGKAVTGTGAK